MRADRLLSLTLLLRHRGRMTAGELAAELEVSERTVLRDVEALSSAGVPVYAERGRHGGFALLPGFSTDLTGLTPDEAVALLTSTARTDALGLGTAFSSAIRKLVAAIPETSRPATDRVLVGRAGWLREASAPGAGPAAVQHAVFAGRRLRIRYASRGGEARWRTIDPLGLVESAGQWYLLALDAGADRTYRVSRISDAEELDEPAHRPDGVDLAALWERRRAEFRANLPTVRVRVRVAPEHRAELGRTAMVIEEHGDEVVLNFGDLGHATRVVWSLVPHATALEPAELVAALRARANEVLSAHEDPGTHDPAPGTARSPKSGGGPRPGGASTTVP